MKSLVSLLAAALLFTAFSCGRQGADASVYHQYDKVMDTSKPLSFGDDADVYLFAGEAVLPAVGETISASLTRKVQLTAEEQYFFVETGDEAQINDYLNYKNLILCGTLDGIDAVSNYMRGHLDKALLGKVQQSGAEFAVVKNALRRDQIFFYLLAKDAPSLRTLADQRSGQIFDLLLERYADRLGYQSYTNAVIDNKLFKNLPYTIQVPQLFDIFSNDKAGNFLSFVYKPRTQNRNKPDKYVSVHYEPMPQNQVTEQWLLAKRQSLADKHFTGDQYLQDRIAVEPVQFAGRDALRLRGAWVNPKLNGGVGGAFQTFAFWDAATQTAYVIDNIAFFPAGDKLPVLLELEVISRSLRLK